VSSKTWAGHRRGEPDFTGAEEAFRTLRAWQFEATFGELLDRERELLKPSLVWNIEQGRRLNGSDIARAESLHAALYHEMRRFFAEYDILLTTVSQVLPFGVELEYPTAIDVQPRTPTSTGCGRRTS
jgi:amidase